MNAENDVELLWDRERDWNREFWRVLEDEYSIDRDELSKNLYKKNKQKKSMSISIKMITLMNLTLMIGKHLKIIFIANFAPKLLIS